MVHNCAEVSTNDCRKILEKYFDNGATPKLIDFSVVPISEDVNGFMGEHLLLKIRIQHDKKPELRFFVKTLPTGQNVYSNFVRETNMFTKEVGCYTFFENVKTEFPSFDVSCIPKYYVSRENEAIVLQDVSEIGYKMWDGPLEMDLKHIELSLKAIAKFHSASFIFEDMKSKKLGRTYRLLEDYSEALEENLYINDENSYSFKYMNNGLKALFALKRLLPANNFSVEDFETNASNLHNQAYEALKPSKKFRNVWCHGDLWAKNIMFQYKGGVPVNCMLFDFQLQRYNPPAHDVLFMIHQTTDKKARQRYFDYLVNYYYDCLKNEVEKFGLQIENCFSRDEYYNSIGALYPTIKLIWSIYKTLSSASQTTLKTITSDLELYAKVSFYDRSEYAVNEFRSYKPYRDLMIRLIGELEDIFTHDQITVEECNTVLRHQLNTTEYDLIHYDMKTYFGEKIPGSDNTKLNITIREQHNNVDKILSFIVKRSPDNGGETETVKSVRKYFKEIIFYSKIIPQMIKHNIKLIKGCVPECYLTRTENKIVFEDYSQDYVILSSVKQIEYEMIIAIIRNLAKMHASGLILDEKLSSPSVKYRLKDDFIKETANKECITVNISKINNLMNVLPFMDLLSKSPGHAETMSELFKKSISKVLLRINDILTPSEKYRNTICHGCLIPDNIMLKFDNHLPAGCLFINFENFRYSPPAHDVLNFLYLSTNHKFRSQHQSDILTMYYSELSSMFKHYNLNINEALSYKDFLNSCEEVKAFSILQCIIYYISLLPTSKDLKAPRDNNSITTETSNEDNCLKEKLCEYIIEFNELCAN